MQSPRYCPACADENRPAPPVAAHNATGRAARLVSPGAGVQRRYFPERSSREANCAAETAARDALPPLRWAAGFSHSGSGIHFSAMSSTRVARSRKKNSWQSRQRRVALALICVVEPAVIDPDTSVLGDAQHIHIAMTETNLGMLVGFSRVDRLRRNNIIAGDHHDQRDVGGIAILRRQPVERAFLADHMEQRPAQGERRALV